MNTENRIPSSQTNQFRIVFPGSLNDNGILFGGTAMQWMDEVAYITALRYTGMKMVTVTADNIHFHRSVRQGTIVEIIGRVIRSGNVKIDIKVEIFAESYTDNARELAADAIFTFAAINEEFKPVRIEI